LARAADLVTLAVRFVLIAARWLSFRKAAARLIRRRRWVAGGPNESA
jgi:hypothetical protein